MTTQIRKHAFVSGLVQGVGFRFSTVAEANRLGLTGWVKNLFDGRVETEFQGDADKVAELESWLHSGPPSATVSECEVELRQPIAGERKFNVSGMF